MGSYVRVRRQGWHRQNPGLLGRGPPRNLLKLLKLKARSRDQLIDHFLQVRGCRSVRVSRFHRDIAFGA